MKKLILLVLLLVLSIIDTPGTVNLEYPDASNIRLKTFIKNIEYQQKQEAILNKSLIMLRIEKIAIRFDLKPKWLLKVFLKEANLNTKAINKYTKAVGLIQFTPATARRLGTSTAKLYRMSFIEQLDYVEKYLDHMEKYLKKIGKGEKIKSYVKSYEDLYLLIFYPKALSRPECYVIGKYNSILFRQNRGMDTNKDKIITVKDFNAFANKI